MSRRIHITGASWAGTTTLGEHLARVLRCDQFDTDDYYWLPTDRPFRIKRDVSESLHMLEAALKGSDYWVLSGSLDCCDPLIPLFTSVVFLETPTEIRL
jgi:hypothetical protein